jgi:hypothetical protein
MRSFVLFLSIALYYPVFAQNSVQMTKGKAMYINTFEPDSLSNATNGLYHVKECICPMPSGIDKQVKRIADAKRQELVHNSLGIRKSSTKRASIQPVLETGFSGAVVAGTPNDNNVAVNNDTMVVSVMNTYIRVYNTDGKLLKNWGLEFFPKDPKATKPGSGVGNLDRSYDPKIVFDPASNRFIIVFLEGSTSADTRIIVSFSKTNNPLDGWNVYQINGNPFGGAYWTDYPMIAINNEDLFITGNILKDNTDWKVGFTQSLIWQLPKSNGYNGDTLVFNLWSNILHEGKPIWNICPVQDAYQPGEEGLYFLSVRPSDISNDTVFLHRISHNYSHGNPSYSYKILKSDKKYGVPPTAPQKQAGFMLQTNDARVLGAYYVNNKIQFVQTSSNSVNGRSSVYHGIIQFPNQANPGITANIISYDSLDIAYPTIVHAGNNVFGKQSLITFSHTGESQFPGTSVVYHNNDGEYSDLLFTKAGEGYINSFIADSSERWGDYTAIQRSYVNFNEYWLVGSYGRSNNVVGTWVSKISMNDPSVSINKKEVIAYEDVYPNPVVNLLTIPFELTNQSQVVIRITDVNGKEILVLDEHQKAGKQKAFINTSNWTKGIYYYSIQINNEQYIHGVFSKQ